MSEERPICPACCRPLNRDLVASGCNHVFHRSCLPEPGKKCVQCGDVHSAEDSLDLFGVSFGEALDPGAAALAAKIAEAECGVNGDQAAVAKAQRLRTAASMLARQDEVKELRKALAEQKALLEAAKQSLLEQTKELDEVKKLHRKSVSDLSKTKQDLTREEEYGENLLVKIDFARQAGTVHEYWDKVKSGNEEAGLKFLSTMVSLAPAPARTLAEVSRLHALVRENLDRERKEADAAGRRFQQGRRELANLEADQKLREGTGSGSSASKRICF